jgi:hypothetical protein
VNSWQCRVADYFASWTHSLPPWGLGDWSLGAIGLAFSPSEWTLGFSVDHEEGFLVVDGEPRHARCWRITLFPLPMARIDVVVKHAFGPAPEHLRGPLRRAQMLRSSGRLDPDEA